MRASLLLLIAVLLFPSFARAAEWYEGGTLHNASIRQWHQASRQNKVATAAGWVVAYAAPGEPSKAGKAAVRQASEDVVRCMDDGTADMPGIEEEPAEEFAVTCMIVLQLQHPFLMTKE